MLDHPNLPMAWLAPRPGNRQAETVIGSAPQGVQAFLDIEVAAEKARPTAGVEGDPRSGPTDVAGEHTVGAHLGSMASF